jgi:biopolymer transport protein ExbB
MAGLLTLIEHGGFAAYLIFLSGIILVILSIERLVTLFMRMSYNVKGSVVTIRSLILDKKYTDAIQVCNKEPGAPELNTIKAGLTAVESGREAMKSALGGAVLEVSHRCEKRVGYIALIANVATLLGLLGTISGLIKTFASIANADPAEKAKMLGLGISEAMYATAAGLFVGITAMVVHAICVAKSESIVGDVQDAGLKLITWIEQSERVKG